MSFRIVTRKVAPSCRVAAPRKAGAFHGQPAFHPSFPPRLMARLLFLGASVSQVAGIRRARAAGHQVVAVDGDRDAVGFGAADVAETVDFSDVAAVAAIGARYQVHGVLTVCSDRAVLPVAAVAEALDLPGIGSEVARAMTDKAVMRECLASAGVPQPRFRVLEWPDSRADRFPLPAVLKPADSGGQRGIFMIAHPEDLDRHLRQTLTFSPSRRALLEEYVEGTELNGMIVVRGGEPALITLSDRLRPGGRAFGVGWIHAFPSSLDERGLAAARTVAFDAIAALGVRDAIVFPQLIVDRDGKAHLIEIAARIAAGQMAELVSFGTGVDLYDVAIAQALGLAVPDELIAARFVRPLAIRFLTAEPGTLPVGTVAGIDGLDEVRASPGVLAADVYFGPGHVIGPLQVDADRSGYIIATGESPADALALADEAAQKLRIRTEPAS
jgi:biotin carboxylase